jgi:hypothetical protein
MGIIRNESRDVMYMSIFRDKLFVASNDTQDPDYKKIEYTVRGGSEKGQRKPKREYSLMELKDLSPRLTSRRVNLGISLLFG